MSGKEQILGKKRLRKRDAHDDNDEIMVVERDASSSSTLFSSFEGRSEPGFSPDRRVSNQPPIRREIKRTRLRRHNACEVSIPSDSEVTILMPPPDQVQSAEPYIDDWLSAIQL